jgi:hypothetical protein
LRRRLLVTSLIVALLAAAAGYTYLRLKVPRLPPAPTAREIEASMRERDALHQRLREIVAARGDQGFAEAPKGGLIIGVPSALTGTIVERIVTGLFGQTRLVLRDIHVHKEGDLKVKMLFSRRRLGHFVLDVEVKEAFALIKPGAPRLTFARERFDLSLPVVVEGGRGMVDLRFQWDGKGLAGLVCGDMDVTRQVGGTAHPASYDVKGAFDVVAEGSGIVVTPRFEELKFLVSMEPSAEALATIDEMVAQKDGLCGAALTKVDVKSKLVARVRRGFNIKLPRKLLKPIRLPAGVQQSLELQGVQLSLHVEPTGLVITPERLWYGADVETTRSEPAAAAP